MTTTTKIIRSMIVAGAAVAALASTPGLADVPTVQINAKGYDLTTSEGVNALTNRVHTAVRQVCVRGSNDLASIQAERACQNETLQSANARIAVLAAMAKTGNRIAGTAPVQTADLRPTR
jgi:UrcA family protein